MAIALAISFAGCTREPTLDGTWLFDINQSQLSRPDVMRTATLGLLITGSRFNLKPFSEGSWIQKGNRIYMTVEQGKELLVLLQYGKQVLARDPNTPLTMDLEQDGRVLSWTLFQQNDAAARPIVRFVKQ